MIIGGSRPVYASLLGTLSLGSPQETFQLANEYLHVGSCPAIFFIISKSIGSGSISCPSPCLLCRSKRYRCDCSGTGSGRSADRKCNGAGFERVAGRSRRAQARNAWTRGTGHGSHCFRYGARVEPGCPVTAREDRGNGATRATISRQPYPPGFGAKTVILTDDGPATGATMHAAVMSLRQRKIARCSRPTCADRISGTVQTHFARLNQQGGTQPLKYLKNLRLLHGNPSPSMQESRRTT
jgi:hypothetical protein